MSVSTMITRRDIDRAHQMALKAQRSADAARGQAASLTQNLVDAAEIGGAALGWGVLKGRYGYAGPMKLGPVPTDLLVGVGLHLLGFTGMIPKGYTTHVHNLANGSLAAYATTLGAGFGVAWRGKAGQPTLTSGHQPGMIGAGQNAVGAEGPLTEAELAAMARATG